MKSPCINVCKIGDNRKCIGCGRTIEEISMWSRLSIEKRNAIMERIQNESSSSL